MSRTVSLAVAMICLGVACAGTPRWRAVDRPTDRDTEYLLTEKGASGLFREMNRAEIPKVPMRENLRPCCAFGARIRVRLGPIPIPGFLIVNVIGPDDVGRHIYDSGVAQVGSRGDESGFLHREHNGLVYTCRGGFVDTAHVRDYADWTIFLAAAAARNLESGVEIRLPDEGGERRVIIAPVDPAVVEQTGRGNIAIPLGQWLAMQLSIWHEIATWFGWSTLDAFPEKVSSFSPEDLYSNLIGARITAAIASQHTPRDDFLYNRSVDEWLERILEYLGAVPRSAGEEAMDAVDGLWWDSTARLPDPALVLRRNFETGAIMTPWLVPPSRIGPKLKAFCGTDSAPQQIANPSAINGHAFAETATLTIEVSDALAVQEPFSSLGKRITQRDFRAIIEVIREQNRAQFGADADRPR